MGKNDERGLSAAQARKIIKRSKPPRKIAAPATYNVHLEGSFAVIKSLCPQVPPRTLLRRLERGGRDLMQLMQPPSGKRAGR